MFVEMSLKTCLRILATPIELLFAARCRRVLPLMSTWFKLQCYLKNKYTKLGMLLLDTVFIRAVIRALSFASFKTGLLSHR